MTVSFKNPIYLTRPLIPDSRQFENQLNNIWGKKWLTNNGEKHQFLEKRLTDHLKAPHLSLFNNGTIALIVAIQALRLSGEVITTPFTFPATPHVLSWNQITPVFCDIDPITMNIDVRKIESMITAKTTGILGVHVFGTACDVNGIQEIADYYGLKVVYDAAHAFGVEIGGRGIGTYGDISMFSFHATKLFHTAEGGALTFTDPNLKTRIDLLRNFGIKNEEEVMMPGINGKMNEIQAALGLVLLDQIDSEIAKRKQVLQTYRNYLGAVEGVTLVKDTPNITSGYQYFPIRIDKTKFGVSRDEVYQRFRECNVYARKYFFPLCSNYPCYRQLPSSAPDKLPIANQVVNEILCLPFYGELGMDTTAQICELLLSFRR